MEEICRFEHEGRKGRLMWEGDRYVVAFGWQEAERQEPRLSDGMAAVALNYLRGHGCLMVEEAARELVQMVPGLSIGRKRLYEWLRENGWCSCRRDTYNQPTQKALGMGYMRLAWKQSHTNSVQGYQRYYVPVITQKGLVWLADTFSRELRSRRRLSQPLLAGV